MIATTRQSNEIIGLSQIREEYEEESTDFLMKKYENMSFDEMSKQMAESNKMISEMISSTTSMSSSHSTSDKEEDGVQDENKKWTNLFIKTASNGDITKLKDLLSDSTIKHFIDINGKDEDGTPPLIYAACFGKLEIAKLLIDAGANIDIQDNLGWSPLMWATNNSHESLVKLLLENGASSHTKSSKGRTVYDFINTENPKMFDILSSTPRDSISSSTSSLFFKTTQSISSSASSAGDNDFYYQSTVEGFNQFMSEEAELRQKLFESTMAAFDEEYTMYNDQGEEEEEEEEEEEDDDDNDKLALLNENEFYWDKCLPDQMFVFNSDQLDHILDTVIINVQLPLLNQENIHVPANVIFLSARFAHYFSTPELLENVLEGALSRIKKVIKINTRNIHNLAFWISNVTQLLFYLKKDTGLVFVTAEQQLSISELVSEIYNLMILDSEKRILKILGPAMLDHEEIDGIDRIDFIDDWQRFFRKGPRRSADITLSSVSPESITHLLSSILFVLQSYDVHPIISIQSIAQLFHFISCELFNRILTNKKLLSRSKAIQIRMNLSHLEDWISTHKLPKHLLNYLNPTIQLLQLLQCLTQLYDLMDFINTTKSFDTLNPPQIKRCVISYRYEVNEPKLPEEIEKYAIQCAEDTVKYKLRKKSMDNNRSRSSLSRNVSRRQSMTLHLNHLPNRPVLVEPSYSSPLKDSGSQLLIEDEDDQDIKETKDSKFMLPFSVPTTAHMVSSHSQYYDSKHHHHHPPRQIIPIIPEDWMELLDKGNPFFANP